MDSILTAVSLAASIFHQTMKEDVMIGVIDKENFLTYIPSKKINLGVKPGTPVPKEDITMQNALKGIPSSERIPTEAYGIPFFGRTFPIHNANGEVIGALGIGYNIENEVYLEEKMSNLENILTELKTKMINAEKGTEYLSKYSQEMNESSKAVTENASKTYQVLNVIQNVAKQTNMLGLNASIEAARAGEQGRGFSVVAEEVRKMSSETAKAAQEIEIFLSGLRNNMQELTNGMELLSKSTEEQVKFAKELNNTISMIEDIGKAIEKTLNNIK